VFPQTFVLRYMDRTVDRQVESLVQWTERVAEPQVVKASDNRIPR